MKSRSIDINLLVLQSRCCSRCGVSKGLFVGGKALQHDTRDDAASSLMLFLCGMLIFYFLCGMLISSEVYNDEADYYGRLRKSRSRFHKMSRVILEFTVCSRK